MLTSLNNEKKQDLKSNATNKLISDEAYISDIWVTSIDFEYSYSSIGMVPFVMQKS